MNFRRKKWSTFIDKGGGKSGMRKGNGERNRGRKMRRREIAKGGGKGREQGAGGFLHLLSLLLDNFSRSK